jgi:two-component system, OmpR family, alkaline phosphatase synthesis response regulator PhoP
MLSWMLPKKGEWPARILVADDERHILRLLQVNLERQGHAVICVEDGREAIAQLEQNTFDLAVIDLMMPQIDGYQVLQWIRTNEATMSMHVVLMTSNADELERRQDLPYRADRYIKKPFNPKEIFPWHGPDL